MEDNRGDAYMSVSGLGNFGADLSSPVKEAVRKLQDVVGTSKDGRYGPGTQSKLVAWVRANVPTLASIPDSAISPSLVTPWLIQIGKMTALEASYANMAWACYAKPNQTGALAETCKGLRRATTAVAPKPVPETTLPSEEWMTGGGATVEEELGFFDKYWWLIAIGALGVGGVVLWKMRQKKVLPAPASVRGW